MWRIPERGLVGAAALLAALVVPQAALADPARVSGLLRRMTIAEKVAMVNGTRDTTCGATPAGCIGEGGYLPGVPRLGVPPLRLGDGPAGIRAHRSTVAMPAPVSLAASFDTDAALRYGAVLGREGRALGLDVVQGPMTNLVRVPLAGRNWETLGEDPFLAAQIAAAEVQAIQAQGAMAQVKHFAENGFEHQRGAANVHVDARTLHENELMPFEAAVRAGVASAMCAYNRVNGVYACSNRALLQDILRGELGFRGFVRSDSHATHRTSDLLAGLDIEIPGGRHFPAIAYAVLHGTPRVPARRDYPAVPAISARAWRAALNRAVRRILGEMDRFGLLDGSAPPRPSFAGIAPADRGTAEQLAIEGATLLVDRGGALPLAPADLAGGGVVVMGPTATAPIFSGRGSAAVRPFPGSASPLAALAALAPRGAQVGYVPGYDLDGEVVPATALSTQGGPGLLRQQVRTDLSNPSPQPGGAPDQVDPTVDYTGATLPAGTAWRWTGTLTAPRTGTYVLNVEAAHQAGVALYVGGRRVLGLGGFPSGGADRLPELQRSHDVPGLEQNGVQLRLHAGERRSIDLRALAGSSAMKLRLSWITPGLPSRRIAEAVAAARAARTAIVFAYDESGENLDRTSLALPGYQDRLIRAVARANPNTVVVLNTGDPVRMPWLRRVAAVLEMWYPGQEGGWATAELLLGRVSPGGKLPVTFPRDWRHQPTFSSDGSRYPGRFLGGHGYPTLDYSEGVFCGYRWYDRRGVRPLFEFGHGLSYTSFRYSGLTVRRRGRGYSVRFVVRNVGPLAGSEVAQVYIGAPRRAPVPLPVRALAGFERVWLQPGRAAAVSVRIGSRALSYWAARRHRWVVARGARTVAVGSSSRDIRLVGQAR